MNSHEFPNAVSTRALFDLELEGTHGWNLGATPIGHCQIDQLHGTFTGIVSGKVVAGNDRLIQAADGTFRPDAHLILEVDRGALIEMRYRGVAAPTDVDLHALLERGTALPAYYHRTAVQFNTAARDWAWINCLLAVGFGRLALNSQHTVAACYRIFQVL